MHGHMRTGSIFVFTLGLLVVMVALSYAFMASARIHRDAGETLNRRSLAEMAAKQGVVHAIEVLQRDYLAHSRVPTTTNQYYVTAFAPIDTLRTGKSKRSNAVVSTAANRANANGYTPWGDPSSWEDENENDTKTEFLLTAVYNRSYGGTYQDRISGFDDGRMLAIGFGRYIEPGYFHTDLVGKPMSFHLDHPATANVTSPDPAVRRGENYLPNRNTPLYLDNNLLPTAAKDDARFRLRYAVAIEDLSGHLPYAWQGDYTDGLADARTATIGPSIVRSSDEVDHATGDIYADSMYNMYFGSRSWWAWLAANGMGHTNWSVGTEVNKSLNGHLILQKFSGGIPQRANQLSSYARPDQVASVSSGNVWASHRGPVASAGQALAFAGPGDSDTPASSFLAYTFTPYGRRPNVVATPSAYRDSYVDCPWQLNLPTAVPEAVTKMVYAYMPREFKTFLYNSRLIQDFNGFALNGAALWTTGTSYPVSVQDSIPGLDLFASSSFSAIFSHLPVTQPYPGSVPAAPGPDWKEDLGKLIDLNTTLFGFTADAGGGPNSWLTKHASPRPPFWGMQASYLPDLKSDVVEKSDAVAGGEQWTLRMPSSGMQGLVKAEGYWYEDSYYMDLATALFHAISATQLAWLEDNGGSSDSYPLDGRPYFPSSMTSPDLIGLLSDALPTAARTNEVMDRDADGDGIVESPSAFDTIKEVDAQFVRNIGEYFGAVLDPSRPAEGLYVVKRDPTTYSTGVYLSRAEYVAWRTSNNIQTLLASATITPAQAKLMELVLNDMRMSFFGASPNYSDFQGLDFDNDGVVRCSAYAGGFSPVVANRFARSIDPVIGDKRFSLTGCFLFQKSRFFRIFVRGEVFDTLRQVPVETAAQEVVYTIDPGGRVFDVHNEPISAGYDPNSDGNNSDADIRDSQVLFQKWHWNRHRTYRQQSSQ